MMDSINHIVKRLRENRILNEREDYSKKSRNELIELAQNGDSLALELLLKSHKDFIDMFARKYFINARGDKDDLFQAGSEGFWQAVMDWNGTGDFEKFAGMYIKRYILAEVDKDNANKNNINTDADRLDSPISSGDEDERTLGDVTPSSTDSIEDEVFYNDLVEKLNKFITSNYKPEEVRVFQMYMYGMKAKDISEEMGMPYKKVDNIIYKIKYNIKQYFQDYPINDSKKPRASEDIEFSDEETQIIRAALSLKNKRHMKESKGSSENYKRAEGK